MDEIGDRFADVGPTSSVLALALELNGSDESSYLSLYVHRLARTLSPTLPALATDIRSGDVIRVVLAEPEPAGLTASENGEDGGDGIQGATLHMLSGPLTGSAYQLTIGDNRVGRVSDNDVVLVDAGVSRNHATISVAPTGVTITDNQSTNGIRVDGHPIQEPTKVQSGQRVLLGRCWVTITFAGSPPPEEVTEREAARETLYLERRPRELTAFEGDVVTLPAPPSIGSRRRRPGGGDQLAVDQFNHSIGTITGQLVELQQNEVAARLGEAPAIGTLAEEIFVDGRPNQALLWQREAADQDGLAVRLGLTTQPSRTQIAVPPGGDQELRDKVVELPERFRTVPDVPAMVNLREAGSVGVYGSADVALALTRSIIGQLVALHGPDQLGVLHRSGSDSREWDWLKWLPHVALTGSRAGVADSEFVATVSAYLSGPQVGRNNQPRPPAVVVLVDDPGCLPPALFPRLVQEAPDVGLYPILLGGDEFPFAVAPQTTVRVGIESANLTLADGTHLGGITIESADRPAMVAMARTMTSVNYGNAFPAAVVAPETALEPDALVVGRFELGGTPPPQWPVAFPAPEVSPAPDAEAATEADNVAAGAELAADDDVAGAGEVPVENLNGAVDTDQGAAADAGPASEGAT
ncbi:MAG: FHA domain-containing protein, partial [Actinomycetota bacterium]